MLVKDVMSKDVISVNLDTTIEVVARLMKDMNIGSVPVCSGEQIVGIVTDRDIVIRGIANGKGSNIVAKDVMTTDVSTVSPSEDVRRAADIMAEKQIRRLPVVSSNEIIGIVSIGDLAIEHKLQDEAGDALSSISQPEPINSIH